MRPIMESINNFAGNFTRAVQRFLFGDFSISVDSPAGHPADCGPSDPQASGPETSRTRQLPHRRPRPPITDEARAANQARHIHLIARKKSALRWLRRQQFLNPDLVPPEHVRAIEKLTAAIRPRQPQRAQRKKSVLSGRNGKPKANKKLTRRQRQQALIRQARRAAKSGELARAVFGDGPTSLVANGLYSLPCEEVDKVSEVNAAIQKAIYDRAEKLREGWTENHRIKANNYHLPPLAYEPLNSSEAGFGGSFRENFE